VKLARVADERAGGKLSRKMPDGSTVSSYQGLYEAKITEQQGLQRALSEQQKNLKENHEPNK